MLMSVLLQDCNNKIKVLLIFKNNKLFKIYEKVIDLFSDKINISCFVEKNISLYKFGLDKCDSKYVMFLKENDFFYDCFSVSSLLKEMDSSDYQFVFGDCVEIVNNADYASINNNYLSANGKIYDVKFLRDNNIKFEDNGDFNIEFVSRCFLLTNRYKNVGNIVSVNRSFQCDFLTNMKFIVEGIINTYNSCVGKIDNDILKNYVFENFDYINSLFIHNIFLVSISEFNSAVRPLEVLYRNINKEV